ncbi:hypothetical protein [Bradyrhizobium sp. USDA 4473]
MPAPDSPPSAKIPESLLSEENGPRFQSRTIRTSGSFAAACDEYPRNPRFTSRAVNRRSGGDLLFDHLRPRWKGLLALNVPVVF